ncbi:unnamed protein product, partial [Mesorhabditis spiculigera]
MVLKYLPFLLVSIAQIVYGVDDVLREMHGFPCRFGSTMRLSRALHGLPQRTKPPFEFKFLDKNSRPAHYYRPGEKYLVRVNSFVHLRGLLLQPRLAHPTGYTIGSLKGGHFEPTRDWKEFGLRFQNCSFNRGDSVTHANSEKKFLFEVYWVPDYDVGDVQFMLTLATENDLFWERWRPRSGFISPISKSHERSQVNERLFVEETVEDGKSMHIHSTPPVNTDSINENMLSRVKKWERGAEGNAVEASSKSSEMISAVTAPSWEKLRNGTPLTDHWLSTTEKTEREAIASTLSTKYPGGLRKRQYPAQLQLDDADLRFLSANLHSKKVARSRRDVTNITLDSAYDCKTTGCANEGICEELVNFAQCKCPEGFTGRRCEEVDYCTSNPCERGVCLNDAAKQTFTCQCDDGYVGSRCETRCPRELCKQGGNCTLLANGQLGCVCPKGTAGFNCEREINECNWLRCQQAKTCIDKFNDYKCICEDGWMGKDCDRPCQDVYGTCRIWERDGECLRTAETDFFEYNCAVTCKQCVYKNETVKTNRPIPHILLPLTWVLGKWRLVVKGKADLPFDFESPGYEEIVTFSVAEGLVFGTPAINFSSVATSLNDPTDQHVSNGFLTIQQYPDDIVIRKAALMSTSNLGYHAIEEGELEGGENGHHKIQFKSRYLKVHPALEEMWPDKTKRTFERKGKKLYQRIAKVKGARGKKFTKIYTRIQEFLY